MSYFINYKYARWLKDYGGFNEWCPYVYDSFGKISPCSSGGTNCTHSKDHCSAPSPEIVAEWLWKSNNFYISISPCCGTSWMWVLYNLRTGNIDSLDISPYGLWNAQRMAVEVALNRMMGIPAPDKPFTSSQPLYFEISRIQKMTSDLKEKNERFLKWAKKKYPEAKWEIILDDLQIVKEFIQSAEDLLEDVRKRSDEIVKS